MTIRNLGILVCLCVAASAFAAGNPNLQPMAGSWTCTGKAFATSMGPEHATKATVSGTWVLDGKWLNIRYKETKTAANPHPVEVWMLMTYDEGKKRVASGCIDNNSDYCTEESGDPAWDGDTMTLTGKGRSGGMDVNVRDTFTKGKGWVKHMGELQPPNGGWIKLDEETCKK